MHYLYIVSIFGAELKEMEREGLPTENFIMPSINLTVLRLISNLKEPLGIFQIIEDKTGQGFG